MAFSPDTFKKAMGAPMGAPAGAPPAGGGMDLESLMGAPGGENMPGDLEGPGGEGTETSLEAALEQANIQASPDQLSKIKDILGMSGGLVPEAGADLGMEGELPPPPAPEKPTSKLGKMFGGGKKF